MSPAVDVARYVVNYSNRKGYGISNLKLQKLLYLIQANFLAFTKEHQKCFPEKIEAWDFGPVVPSVYREFKKHGGNPIPTVKRYLLKDEKGIQSGEFVEFSEDVIPDHDKTIINQVVDSFAPFTASDLVDLTHNQAPWKNAHVYRANREITPTAIRDYFEKP